MGPNPLIDTRIGEAALIEELELLGSELEPGDKKNVSARTWDFLTGQGFAPQVTGETERKGRLKELVKEGKYTQFQILTILTNEFPTYPRSNHLSNISNSKDQHRGRPLGQLVLQDPITGILFFE